ncbi:hypothetical protein [Nioella nitratireducens]|uniref:hypothetical protein n=1 Tax=Nioella nitratireducens TaxID=1287720 RepID=UPI0008FD0762|nr:hypothetical protein [Nioella nitratireducens]
MDDQDSIEDNCDPIMTSSECADECLREAEKTLGATLSQLEHLSYVDILLSVHPGIETHFTEYGWVYHSVEQSISQHLSIQATGLHEAFLMVREICARNIAVGAEIPKEFRPMCSLLVRGKRSFVSARGRAPASDFAFKWACIEIADYLAQAYKIPISRGDGMNPDSACDIVSEALARRGIDVPYERIRDWLTHSKHKKVRGRAKLLSAFLKDEILFSVGVLPKRRDWVLSPFGQMLPIGRIT